MSQDTKYKPFPYIFSSRGIFARFATDRPPGEGYYLNLSGAEEREEQVLSSRHGSTIINRDPFGSGTNNYFFLSAPVTLARLVNGPLTYRYAGLANGQIWRRAGDTRGPYTNIFCCLSGQKFSTIVTPCYQSAQPYLFIADSVVMLKDSGTGTPTTWGINLPNQVNNTLPYAPVNQLIEGFTSPAGFTTTGFSISGVVNFATVNGFAGVSVLGGNYERYSCSDISSGLVQDGSIGKDTVSNQLGLKFNTLQDTTKFSIVNFSGGYVALNSFIYGELQGTVAANSTGSIGKTMSMSFADMLPDDLFVLVIAISSPQAISEVRLQFDIRGSGYTSNYYYKSISPTSFQAGVSAPQVTPPSQAVTSEVSSQAGGVNDQNNIGVIPFIAPGQASNPNLGSLQPRPLTTGSSSWSVVYMRKGDFVAVGNAGEPGLDWQQITGWQIQIITTTGSVAVGLNGLYTQKGSGPSSYGGVGYDYRYTYFDAVTNTESNPCAQQVWPITPSNPAGTSLMVVLRQAINVQGQYSANSRVTHIRIYRRGGTLPTNWLLVDQIPNIVSSGTFSYKDIFADSAIAVQPILNVANDPPVTSTLQNPIVTTLVGSLNPVAPFVPILVPVTNPGAVFQTTQIVNIGPPGNFEQVVVVANGAGSFTACVQLPHLSGEPVTSFATPAQPCNLCALAYNQVWFAGDPNNPHLLYYAPQGFPENVPPQNYIPVTSPADPIMAIINFRGTLFVATKSTWYQIYPGSPPTAQPTGSRHGLAASFGWTITEGGIWYQSWDGIREFRGADGAYRSILIEWLFQGLPTSPSPTPIAALDPTKIGQVTMAYWNNQVFVAYPGLDGNNHRLIFNTVYNRWRNDDLYINAIFYESDTNTLLIARTSTPGAAQGLNYVVAQDQVGDFDDAGWAAGLLVQAAIPLNIQTPYYDQNQIDNQKQYNMLDIDANPNGQTLTPTLLFDDNNGSVPSIILPSFTGALRQKFTFIINNGLGQQAYRMSIKLTGPTVVAPIIYQMEMHAAELAEQLNSYDTYWIKFGQDESKLVKQGYFDYTSTAPTTVSLFADGSSTPYFTFILPTNLNRAEVPQRVRFSPMKLRLFRLVAVCAGGIFQLWAAPQIDQKPVKAGSGYSRSELTTA